MGFSPARVVNDRGDRRQTNGPALLCDQPQIGDRRYRLDTYDFPWGQDPWLKRDPDLVITASLESWLSQLP